MTLGDPVSPQTESRLGGLRQIAMTFSEPVDAVDGLLDATEFVLSHGQVDTVSHEGAVVTVDISGVPDACCFTVQAIGLRDDWGNQLAASDGIASIGVLEGDTNNDGNTNVIDLGQVAALSGSTTVEGLARADVNLDGFIDVIDLGAVATLSGSSVDCNP